MCSAMLTGYALRCRSVLSSAGARVHEAASTKSKKVSHAAREIVMGARVVAVVPATISLMGTWGPGTLVVHLVLYTFLLL